jgi:hypothetical protein
MTREEAENLSILFLQLAAKLDESAAFVKDKDSEANWIAYRSALGKLMGAVYFDLAEPLWARFPDLRPRQLDGPYEVDVSIYEPVFYRRD